MKTIPSDWVINSLGSISNCLDNKRIPVKESDRRQVSALYPYCGANGVLGFIDDFIFDEDIILIAEDGGNFYDWEFRPIAYRMREKCWVNNHAHVITAKTELVDQGYLFYSLEHKDITSLLVGGTRAKLNRSVMDKIEIAHPENLREQKAIAEALSDIDELITFLKRELIKKINLRTAFTQRRLKFENAKKVKLGNYANFSKGSGLPKSQLTTNGKFKAIHYGELFLKYPESIRRVISRTDTASNAIYSRVNDVLMPSSDVTPTGLAVASCIREDDVILGGDVLIIRPNSASELDGRYLSYVIRNSKQEILKLVRGTTVYHIYGKDMADFELFLPRIDEQIEIVESLDLQREEISQLEEELQKYEWLKQGMMNDLLTGKVRLV